MSKQAIPLLAEDISLFSRALARQLKNEKQTPSHLGLMNMIARAAGFRNFQHLRAAHMAGQRLAVLPEPEPVDHRLVERALHQFDAEGRLQRWHSRRKIQDLCLWVFWARLPSGTSLSEREVNRLLRAEHLFDDPALLRRMMFNLGMVTRNRDGSDYRRLEQRPPAEARALIRLLEARRKARRRADAESISASV